MKYKIIHLLILFFAFSAFVKGTEEAADQAGEESTVITIEEVCQAFVRQDNARIAELISAGVDILEQNILVPMMDAMRVSFFQNLLRTHYSNIPDFHHQLFTKGVEASDNALLKGILAISSSYLITKNDEYIKLVFDRKNFTIMKDMASYGFNPNVTICDDCEKKYPLHHSVSLNDFNMVKALLAFPNIDVNLESGNGKTPIHYSICSVMSEMLHEHGADFDKSDSQGNLSKAAIIDSCNGELIRQNLPLLSDRQAAFARYCLRYLTESQPKLYKITLDRNEILEGIWTVYQAFPEAFLYNTDSLVTFNFIKENAQDAGGISRECLSLFTERIFTPRAEIESLSSATDSATILFNNAPFEKVDESNHLFRVNAEFDGPIELYKPIGAHLAFLFVRGFAINARLVPSLLKLIFGDTLTFEDLKADDPVMYQALSNMLKPNFSFKKAKLKLLSDERVKVTPRNVHQFLDEKAVEIMYTRNKAQIDLFIEGFRGVFDPKHLKTFFNIEEIQTLLKGEDSIDIEQLKQIVKFEGEFWSLNAELFWDSLAILSNAELLKLFRFVSGMKHVPYGGITKINNLKVVVTDNWFPIPSSSTCSFKLYLPTDVDSPEDLVARIRISLSNRIDMED